MRGSGFSEKQLKVKMDIIAFVQSTLQGNSKITQDNVFYRKDRLDHLDTWAYITLCPFSLICSVSLLLIHLVSKELRKQPGDLIMMIAVGDGLLACHYLSTSLGTNFAFGFDQKNDSNFCLVNSFIALTGASFNIFYHFSLLASLAITVVSTNTTKISSIWFHMAALFTTAWVVSSAYLGGNLGRNPYGTCSFKHIGPVSITSTFVLLLSVTVFSVWLIVYTNKKLPQHTDKLATLKRNFINFYSQYLKLMIMIWSLLLLSVTLENFGQTDGPNINQGSGLEGIKSLRKKSKVDYRQLLFLFGKLGQIVKTLSPILMFMVRSQDPAVTQNVSKVFFRGLGDRETSQNSDMISADIRGSTVSHRTVNTLQTSADTEGGEIDIELKTSSKDLYWVNLLSETIKQSLHRTLLATVAGLYEDVLEQFKTGKIAVESDSKEISIHNVDGKAMMDFLECSELESILNCTVSIFAPRLFLDIINSHFNEFNFRRSLDPKKNARKILRIAQSSLGQGGKSNEFFFLTHDRKLILKTISDTESAKFLDFLFDYSRHFLDYPESLIGRIFGLFEVQFEGTQKSVKFFIMEALDPIYKAARLRKFDLKGSDYDRETLDHRTRRFTEYDPIKKVLKDRNFEKIDWDFKMPDKSKKTFLSQIKSDTLFFRKHKIIDYSLIVTIVDKLKFPKEHYIQKIKEKRNYRVMESRDGDLLYFFGIIDYFQVYDWMKRAEVLIKRAITCNIKLDTSAQPPEVYATRFFKRMTLYCYRGERSRSRFSSASDRDIEASLDRVESDNSNLLIK